MGPLTSKDIPSRPEGWLSPIFIKTEKVKQNEKTEKYVSKKRIKKKTWKNPNEAEINNLSDEELKVKVMKNVIELRKRTDEHNDNFDKK